MQHACAHTRTSAYICRDHSYLYPFVRQRTGGWELWRKLPKAYASAVQRQQDAATTVRSICLNNGRDNAAVLVTHSDGLASRANVLSLRGGRKQQQTDAHETLTGKSTKLAIDSQHDRD